MRYLDPLTHPLDHPLDHAPRRPAVLALVVVLLAALAAWVPAPPAAAHDDLVLSDPADSGVVEELPSRAVLTLSGPVRKVREVTVTGPEGDVTNGAPSVHGAEVRQNLWAGPDGDYVIAYEVVSSDGHEVTGEIHFEVGPTSGPTATAIAREQAEGSGGWNGSLGILVLGGVLVAGAGGLVVVRRRRLGGEQSRA